MANLKSLGILLGTGRCNASCAHCAGKALRDAAPSEDGGDNFELIEKTLQECYDRGARSLSLSSTGETLLSPKSVTRTLEIVSEMAKQGRAYEKIHLYTNGSLLDAPTVIKHLKYWKFLGLDTIYLTIHSITAAQNAAVYGISPFIYPPFTRIASNLHWLELKLRCNLLLNKDLIPTVESYCYSAEKLLEQGADSICSWQIRDENDQVDQKKAFSSEELDQIVDYFKNDSRVRIIREDQHQQEYQEVTKLTLFPDGTLSSSWCSK